VNEVAEPVATGVITGGWSYIWAAYGVTWAALLLFLGRALLLSRAPDPEPE
jgi:hypothetical protein